MLRLMHTFNFKEKKNHVIDFDCKQRCIIFMGIVYFDLHLNMNYNVL